MDVGELTVKVSADTSEVVRTCRVIAKHLGALADELDGKATSGGDITINVHHLPEKFGEAVVQAMDRHHKMQGGMR